MTNVTKKPRLNIALNSLSSSVQRGSMTVTNNPKHEISIGERVSILTRRTSNGENIIAFKSLDNDSPEVTYAPRNFLDDIQQKPIIESNLNEMLLQKISELEEKLHDSISNIVNETKLSIRDSMSSDLSQPDLTFANKNPSCF